MGLLKSAGLGGAGVLLIIGIVVAVIAFSIVIGGLVGAGIAALYNTMFGTTFALTKFAAIGSIVGVVGGASASSE